MTICTSKTLYSIIIIASLNPNQSLPFPPTTRTTWGPPPTTRQPRLPPLLNLKPPSPATCPPRTRPPQKTNVFSQDLYPGRRDPPRPPPPTIGSVESLPPHLSTFGPLKKGEEQIRGEKKIHTKETPKIGKGGGAEIRTLSNYSLSLSLSLFVSPSLSPSLSLSLLLSPSLSPSCLC